ncbi:hypothetical protein [Klebsiella sp. BIGb0407]|uniref:hypothetical protein n=1 Tax=Klebsiella sp. BIGb0407 TaxID=2940603 RepID=UPI002168FD94|nr:hypothetical protein [Klebsiella sp. BIGb0407]MCS3430402.1 hypothetical protein [Klebsiella sp. BIGb0407]
MQEGIRRSCHRIGLAVGFLCFLCFSLLLMGEINAGAPGSISPWYFVLAATLSIFVYCAFRLLGWLIQSFFPQHGR